MTQAASASASTSASASAAVTRRSTRPRRQATRSGPLLDWDIADAEYEYEYDYGYGYEWVTGATDTAATASTSASASASQPSAAAAAAASTSASTAAASSTFAICEPVSVTAAVEAAPASASTSASTSSSSSTSTSVPAQPTSASASTTVAASRSNASSHRSKGVKHESVAAYAYFPFDEDEDEDDWDDDDDEVKDPTIPERGRWRGQIRGGTGSRGRGRGRPIGRPRGVGRPRGSTSTAVDDDAVANRYGRSRSRRSSRAETGRSMLSDMLTPLPSSADAPVEPESAGSSAGVRADVMQSTLPRDLHHDQSAEDASASGAVGAAPLPLAPIFASYVPYRRRTRIDPRPRLARMLSLMPPSVDPDDPRTFHVLGQTARAKLEATLRKVRSYERQMKEQEEKMKEKLERRRRREEREAMKKRSRRRHMYEAMEGEAATMWSDNGASTGAEGGPSPSKRALQTTMAPASEPLAQPIPPAAVFAAAAASSTMFALTDSHAREMLSMAGTDAVEMAAEDVFNAWMSAQAQSGTVKTEGNMELGNTAMPSTVAAPSSSTSSSTAPAITSSVRPPLTIPPLPIPMDASATLPARVGKRPYHRHSRLNEPLTVSRSKQQRVEMMQHKLKQQPQSHSQSHPYVTVPLSVDLPPLYTSSTGESSSECNVDGEGQGSGPALLSPSPLPPAMSDSPVDFPSPPPTRHSWSRDFQLLQAQLQILANTTKMKESMLTFTQEEEEQLRQRAEESAAQRRKQKLDTEHTQTDATQLPSFSSPGAHETDTTAVCASTASTAPSSNASTPTPLQFNLPSFTVLSTMIDTAQQVFDANAIMEQYEYGHDHEPDDNGDDEKRPIDDRKGEEKHERHESNTPTDHPTARHHVCPSSMDPDALPTSTSPSSSTSASSSSHPLRHLPAWRCMTA